VPGRRRGGRDLGDRQRARDPERAPRPDLRPVRDDQAAGEGDRPRPRRLGAADRCDGRDDQSRERGRRRCPVHDPPARRPCSRSGATRIMTVLIIDDEPGLRQTVSLILSEEGYDVHVASDGEEGFARALEVRPDIILCDVRMPRLNGIEFLERYRAANGEALVVVMTAYGSMDLAIEAMKKGAYDYISKPFSADQLILLLKKAEEREALRREVRRLRQEVRVERRFGQIIAKSPAMQQALELAVKV